MGRCVPSPPSLFDWNPEFEQRPYSYFHVSHSLNSLKGGYIGDYIRDYYRDIKGDTRSLDYGSCVYF